VQHPPHQALVQHARRTHRAALTTRRKGKEHVHARTHAHTPETRHKRGRVGMYVGGVRTSTSVARSSRQASAPVQVPTNRYMRWSTCPYKQTHISLPSPGRRSTEGLCVARQHARTQANLGPADLAGGLHELDPAAQVQGLEHSQHLRQNPHKMRD
jgi:hypothetical protein